VGGLPSQDCLKKKKNQVTFATTVSVGSRIAERRGPVVSEQKAASRKQNQGEVPMQSPKSDRYVSKPERSLLEVFVHGKAVGAAFIVQRKAGTDATWQIIALTAWHLFEKLQSEDRKESRGDGPGCAMGTPVKARFYATLGDPFSVEWYSIDKENDLGAIKWRGPWPHEVEKATLNFRMRGQQLLNQKVTVRGYPEIKDGFINSVATESTTCNYTDDTKTGNQLLTFRALEVKPGFSGSPLWDKTGHILGMVRRSVYDQKTREKTGDESVVALPSFRIHELIKSHGDFHDLCQEVENIQATVDAHRKAALDEIERKIIAEFRSETDLSEKVSLAVSAQSMSAEETARAIRACINNREWRRLEAARIVIEKAMIDTMRNPASNRYGRIKEIYLLLLSFVFNCPSIVDSARQVVAKKHDVVTGGDRVIVRCSESFAIEVIFAAVGGRVARFKEWRVDKTSNAIHAKGESQVEYPPESGAVDDEKLRGNLREHLRKELRLRVALDNPHLQQKIESEIKAKAKMNDPAYMVVGRDKDESINAKLCEFEGLLLVERDQLDSGDDLDIELEWLRLMLTPDYS
jgi:hypothetical protein